MTPDSAFWHASTNTPIPHMTMIERIRRWPAEQREAYQRIGPLSRGWRHDLRCGLHSGIPACCVAWYLVRSVLWAHAFRVFWRLEVWRLAACERLRRHAHYVLCPLCLARNHTQPLLICDCSLRHVQ